MVADAPHAASPTPPAGKFNRRAEGKVLLADRPLSRQEDVFVDAVLNGWPYSRCYITATASACKKASAEQMAWRWMQRPALKLAIERRRAALDERRAMTRVEKRVHLANLTREPATPAAVKVNAIQADNRMTGDDEPIKLSVSAHMVFCVDPIGEGTRGQRVVEELTPEEARRGELPAGESTIELKP